MTLHQAINADIDTIIQRLEETKRIIGAQDKIDEVLKSADGVQNVVNYWNYKLEKYRNGI